MPSYVGFSSMAKDGPDVTVIDYETIKADLLNHLSIRLGEVPGRPGFGTIIYDTLAEPFDDITEEVLQSEVQRIVQYDPRVRARSVDVFSDREESSILIRAELEYVETSEVDVLEAIVDAANQSIRGIRGTTA